jgi:hypothetical protein
MREVLAAEAIASPDPRTLEYEHQMRDVLAAEAIASPDHQTLEFKHQMRDVLSAAYIASPDPLMLEYKDQLRDVPAVVALVGAQQRDQQNVPLGTALPVEQSAVHPVLAALMRTQAKPDGGTSSNVALLDSGAPGIARTRQGIDP